MEQVSTFTTPKAQRIVLGRKPSGYQKFSENAPVMKDREVERMKRTVIITKHSAGIPPLLCEAMNLKMKDRIMLYKDKNGNLLISKVKRAGWRLKDISTKYGHLYFNSNIVLKNGYKIGEGDFKEVEKVNIGNVECFVLIKKGVIDISNIEYLSYNYRGGSNSLAVLYPNKPVITVTRNSFNASISEVVEKKCGLKKGSRMTIICHDKQHYIAFTNNKNSTISVKVSVKYRTGRLYFNSVIFKREEIKPAVYELVEHGEFLGMMFYKLVKIGEPLSAAN